MLHNIEINNSLEHLNVLLLIFFVSGVFQNFEVDFWLLLKGKSASPEAILAGIFFFFKILFFIIHMKDINFEPAGLLKIVLIVTPLFKQDNVALFPHTTLSCLN